MIQITPTGERYRDVQPTIDSQFPTGRFVAVEQGQVVADAPTHRELVAQLLSLGKSPKDMLILQAGSEYPASAVIFLGAAVRSAHG